MELTACAVNEMSPS